MTLGFLGLIERTEDRVIIRIEDSDQHPLTELGSLADWLRHDDSLRAHRVTIERGEPTPGSMAGGWVEAVQVIVGSGGVSGLITAIAAWITARKQHVVITVTDRSGDSVTCRVDGVDAVDDIRKEIARLTGGDG